MEQQETPQLIVHHEWSIARIVLLMILVLGLGIGVLATLTLRDVRSKADVAQPIPTPLVEIVAPPPADLKAPYIRLVTPKNTYGFNTTVPVDVYLHTGGKDTAEADLSISYSPDLFDITKEDIKKTDVYKVENIEAEEGKITMSLFVTPSLADAPIKTESEKKIATLTFKTKTLASDNAAIKLDFKKGDVNQTNLATYSATREDKPTNLLEGVADLILTIKP